MKEARKNILWLVSWYPNKTEPLAGDFIERHARAASLLHNIQVIFLVRDHLGVTPGKLFIEKRNYRENAQATILYYKTSNSFFSGLKYFYYYRKLIKEYLAANGKPSFLHVHICYKAGLMALYSKWFFKLDFIVSEQWTIFCKEAKHRFSDKSFLTRWLIKLIYKNASRTSAVSDYLGNALKNEFGIPKPVRIPNVVDTKLFYPSAVKNKIYRFIHISLLNYQKNPGDIFAAVKKLTALTHERFELVIFGPIKQECAEKVQELGIGDYIQFKGEVSHDILSHELRSSHALILYSRYETFGCVIVEAYASGVPVIVSDIPVMREIVNENTGVFAKPCNAGDLAEKMLWMMNNHQSFNSNAIAAQAEEKYGFGTVAKQFGELYKGI